MTYSYYHRDSGELCGFTYSGPPGSEDLAAPADHLPIPGRFSRARFRVVQADDGYGNMTPTVVPRLPDRPEDTEHLAWELCEETSTWLSKVTLAGARAAKWADIKVARDAWSRPEVLVVEGRPWQVDVASRAAIAEQLQVATLVGSKWSTVWKLADNSRVTVTAKDLKAVVLACGLRVDSAHQRAAALHEAIAQAATIEAVQAVSWD
jgi:hypothetical protein